MSSDGDVKLENLDALLVDEQRIEFLAAAIERADEDIERGSEAPTWWLLVTEPSKPLPRGQMNVVAVTETGAIYVGRGRWKDRRVSRDRRLQTDLVEGIENLRVGSVTQVDTHQST